MVMTVVIVLLSTINTNYCSTWRGDSSGDPSCEVGENKLTNSKTYLVGI